MKTNMGRKSGLSPATLAKFADVDWDWSDPQIAAKLGGTPQRIQRVRKCLGKQTYHQAMRRRFREWLEANRDKAQGKSLQEIRGMYDGPKALSPVIVSAIRKELGLARCSPRPRNSWPGLLGVDDLTARVDKQESGCWFWLRPTPNGHVEGYRLISVQGQKVYAHRHVYERCVGPLAAGQVVRHRCDNPSCVNPEHLEVGTHADNIKDRESRGRSNRRARIPDHEVRELRGAPMMIAEVREAARRLGVSSLSVYRAARGRSYKHVHQ